MPMSQRPRKGLIEHLHASYYTLKHTLLIFYVEGDYVEGGFKNKSRQATTLTRIIPKQIKNAL